MIFFGRRALRLRTYGLPVLLLWSASLHAQSARMERIHQLYDQLAFAEVIPLYESMLKEEYDMKASIRLADAYRLTSNHQGAEHWYAQVVNTGMAEPIYQYYYAQSLLKNGKIAEAREQYAAYATRAPQDVRGVYGVQACDQWEEMAAQGINCRISNLGINSPRSDFAPVMLGKQLIFVSDRDSFAALQRNHLWTGRDFLNIYLSRVSSEGALRNPSLLPGKLNGPFHDGPVALDSSGQLMYLTRNTYQKRAIGRKARESSQGIVKLSLHRASRQANSEEWAMDDWAFPFNNDEYSSGHPALSRDGRTLIFASDQPGGYGGVDLYRCQLKDDGSWTLPQNLGPEINTPGDELFPVLHPSGDLLFASDGLPGLGGLDLFLAVRDSSQWKSPRNLGAPLNTFSDDFSLVMDVNWEYGYFSSDRPGGRGSDDIYAVELAEPQLKVRLRDARSGEWLSGIPMRWMEGDQLLSERSSGGDGEQIYSWPRGRQFRFMASDAGYRPIELNAPLSDLLSPPLTEWVLDLEPLARISLVAQVIDRESRRHMPNAEVILDNINTAERIAILADEDELYRADLEPSARYRLTADLDGYLGDERFIQTPDQLEEKEFYEILELSSLEEGVVIELSNIYYDLDKWYIRRDAAEDLNRLALLMLRYPTMRIELASHTDARATSAYNMVLSQRRAEAAVAYLVARGVPRERMSARGYGESQPRNRCVDGVPCTEREHQFNRRTEFKVTNFSSDIESRDKDQIPVNTYLPADPEYLKEFLERELQDMGSGGNSGAAQGQGRGGRSGDQGGTAPGTPSQGSADPTEVWFQSGMAYGVHLGSGTAASANRFDRFKDLGQIQFEPWHGGRFLFVLGYFTSKKEAEDALKTVLRRGLNEAYLVTYRDGERQN